jgi:hypothetical protein
MQPSGDGAKPATGMLKQDELMWNRSISCRHRLRKRAIQ